MIYPNQNFVSGKQEVLQVYKNKPCTKINQCGRVSLLPPREGLVLTARWKLEKYRT